MTKSNHNKTLTSLSIIVASMVLAFAPIPGVKQTLIVVSGTELQEPLREIETKFEQEQPGIDLELKFQGSQDMVNNYLEQTSTFQPNIMIPANGEILQELSDRWLEQHNLKVFAKPPQAIAETVLVGIAWQDRGQALFPDGKFDWDKIGQIIQQPDWSKHGGQKAWGKFDFVMTNPTRSNSGQLALGLWLQSENSDFVSPQAKSLTNLLKKSVYQPPRSTDILLQEFITRGSNGSDFAMVYESIALHRWSQAKTTQDQHYRLYYPQPTFKTTATAAILKPTTSKAALKASQKFLDYLTTSSQQQVFAKYGFRPIAPEINLSGLASSPWSKNIPGAQLQLDTPAQNSPSPQAIKQIQQLWNETP